MWSSVDLREIRTFLTLAEELHYGRTAQQLELTPSRVSQTIRAVEARVGGRLFDRTSRRVRLTPLGEQLVRDMAPAYEQLKRAFDGAREVATGDAGTLRLGMYSPLNGGPHLLEIVKTFQARHAACRVQLTETGFTRDQLEWLRHDDVDLLAMRLPLNDPTIAIGPLLSRESRVLLVAKDHPLAAKESLSYDDLVGFTVPWISTLPPEMLDVVVPPRTASGHLVTRILVRSLGEALMRVATGEIVHPTVGSFLDHFPHPDVWAIPIRDLPPSETALIWLKASPSARVDAFARAAADVVRARGLGPGITEPSSDQRAAA